SAVVATSALFAAVTVEVRHNLESARGHVQAHYEGPGLPGGVVPDRYPAIEDHAVIGDLHTVALVATDGTIDWCCLPRFDSPAVFASVLDSGRGGCFAVRSGAVRTRQLYKPGTNVLVTRFLGTGSVGEVVDFTRPCDVSFSVLLVRDRVSYIPDLAGLGSGEASEQALGGGLG